MSDTANTNDERTQTKPRRSLASRLFRLSALSGLILLLLFAGGIGFTETASFRSLLRDFLTETADSSLNAQLSIESIDGNIFSGWKISGVRLTDDFGTIAEIRSLVLRYNLFRLPWKVANIRELTLNEPRIYITRAAGRDWNINTMLPPPEEDEDTTSVAFDWDIRVEYLRILDGMLLVYDSSEGGPPPRDRLDTRHMKLTDINLALSAGMNAEEKRVSIDRFSFRNAFGDVSLKNLSGDILLTAHSASVDNLSLQTAQSGMILSAAVDSVDVLAGFDRDRLPDLPLRISLDAPRVVLRDLQYVLPSLDILGSSARLALKAEGSLRSLEIEDLQLEAERSSIAFTGRLRDILEGADMHIDVTSDDTHIHGQDIPLLLPGIPILDLEEMGAADFSLLRFKGHPLRFEAAMDMESGAGAAAGRISLDLTGEDLVYDGMVRTRGLDLSRVLRSPRLSSSLTVQAAIKGSGTQIGSIVAQLNVRADSSRYQRYLADDMRLAVDVRRDSLTLDLTSRLGNSSFSCSGGMSFLTDSITGFRISGDATRFDLAKLLNDDDLSTDLTLDFMARGDGVDLASASGSVEVAFAPSRFRDIAFEQDTFRIVLQQGAGSGEYLLLQSQYADARIDGRFDFPRFFDYFSLQADSLSAAMAQFAFAPDSTDADAEEESMRSRTTRSTSLTETPVVQDTSAFMDVFYSITLKNPERIARYFDARTFLVRGTYRGNIHGGYDGFSVDGQLQLSDFYFVDSSRTLLAAGVRCNYDIRNLQLRDPLQHLTAELRFTASDMHLNGLRLSRTAVEFDYAQARPRLRVRSMVDTLLQLDLQAGAKYRDYGFDVEIPVLRLLYLQEDWRNERPVQLRIDSAGIALQQFALRHDAMRLALTGTRSFRGENSFTLYGDSLRVGMVEYLTTGQAEARANRSFTGMAFVEATLGGSDATPLMAADVYVDSLGYRGMHFGEMVLEARYFDRQLELYSELDYDKADSTQEKVFFLSGTVPVNISLSEEEAQEVDADAEASLRLQMREFPLALIEDFLGFFSPLEGSAFGDVTVSGTAESPSFEGYLTISNARGRFVYNNMEYLLNLRIEAVEQNIRIVRATVENTSADWSEGRLSASGSISTEAFAIDEFDLAVEGKLKVLQPASRASLRALYGDLYISTGAEQLTYTGRLDRSRLTGNLVVERGSLTFPLAQTGAGVNEYSGITYVVVDDTTKQVVSSLSAGRFGRLAAAEGDAAVQKPERSVLEGLSYDLRISTDGRLVVRIPFSVLQEELNAALEFDDLKVSSFGGDGMTFVGEVQLGPESSFLFLGKRLSADGSLYFTRDPMNPDLDLKAVYSDYYISPETDATRRVYVILNITGTKNAPKLDWDLRWDAVDGEPVAAAGDVQSDASSFLLFGVFASDISAGEGEGSSFATKSPELVNQLGSSIASTAVTQLFNRLGFEDVIKRIDFSGIGTENSRVKLTSEIGQSIITYDGKIDDYRSSNLTVEFPLSRIVGIPWLNQVIQISRITTNQGMDNPAQPAEYSVWELKILQRFSF